MQSRTFVPFLASLALCASAALAQDTTPAASGPGPTMRMHHFDKADMEKFHAQMCTDRYARAVGGMAYLETKLALTDTQKPLFIRWKSEMLAAAKARSADCGTMQRPGPDASIMDRFDRRTAQLEKRLAEFKAERPSLEALVKSLNPDQVKELEHAAMQARHARFAMMGRHMGHGMGGDHGGGHMFMHRDGGDAPPPPPAQ